jgi:hypothetical protein
LRFETNTLNTAGSLPATPKVDVTMRDCAARGGSIQRFIKIHSTKDPKIHSALVGYNSTMSRTLQSRSLSEAPITGDQLTNALRALDVNFIMGGQIKGESLHKQPARLITALAESDESRLRLSLIPLFLEHPQFARHVRSVAKKLKPQARLTLLCYYSAAVWLAQKYHVRNGSLPDYFSEELNLHISADPEENLRELAKRHRTLSGMKVNWLGTYQHAARVWQKGLEYKKH